MHKLQTLIDAPLASTTKINLPKGRRPLPSGGNPGRDPVARQQIEARKGAQRNQKLEALYDYYATTDLPFERIAEHMGITKSVQTGTTDKGRPIMKTVPDAETVRRNIEARRGKVQA